jgi:hypothetical protein
VPSCSGECGRSNGLGFVPLAGATFGTKLRTMKGRSAIVRKPTARSGWWNVVLGGWLLVAPTALNFGRVAAVNHAIVGMLLVILAWGPRSKGRTRTGLDVMLGIWLIASPFVLSVHRPLAFWNSIAVGSAVVLINGTARPLQGSGSNPAALEDPAKDQ